jgi:hypothetical protein
MKILFKCIVIFFCLSGSLLAAPTEITLSVRYILDKGIRKILHDEILINVKEKDPLNSNEIVLASNNSRGLFLADDEVYFSIGEHQQILLGKLAPANEDQTLSVHRRQIILAEGVTATYSVNSESRILALAFKEGNIVFKTHLSFYKDPRSPNLEFAASEFSSKPISALIGKCRSGRSIFNLLK